MFRSPRSQLHLHPKSRRPRPGLLSTLVLVLGLAGQAMANPNFNVAVNTGVGDPSTVVPGEATSLRIALSNNSDALAINDVSFTQSLPETATGGLRVLGAASISGSAGCTGDPDVTVGGTHVSLANMTIPVNGVCYLDIPVAAWSFTGAAATHVYSLPAGSVSCGAGCSNATGGSQGITVNAVPRPTWSKSFSTSTLLLGNTTTMTITVNNPASIDLTNIEFTDTFPVGSNNTAPVITATGINAATTCGGTPTLLAGGAGVSISGLDLAAGGSCNLVVDIAASHTDEGYQVNRTNSIPAGSFFSDQGLRPGSNANAGIVVRSPLAVQKAFANSPIASGDTSTFTVILTNNGSSALEVDELVDNPVAAAPHQDRITITNVVNSCGGTHNFDDYGDQGFRVNDFTIAAGGNCVITVTFTAETPDSDQPTSYTNSIPQGAVEIGNISGIVSQAASASVLVADRLRALKSRSPANAAPGNAVNYQITVQNFSTDVLDNVDVTDVLANGSSLLLGGSYAPTLSAACGTWDISHLEQGDETVTFTVPELPARTAVNQPGVCVISFWAMIGLDATTGTSNVIESGGVCFTDAFDETHCNAVPSNTVSTSYWDVLQLFKSFSPASGSEGTLSRLRLEVRSFSDNALTNLSINDSLPGDGPFAQLQVANPPNVTNSCGGSVTLGSDSITLNGGSVPARSGGTPGSCVLEVNVVGPAGVYENTADAAAIQHPADGNPRQVFADDTATMTYSDALTASKSFQPSAIGVGGTARARIRLGNLDPDLPLTGLALTDELPTGLLVASPANAYTTCNGPTTITANPGADSVSLSGAVVAPGASCDLLFNVTAIAASPGGWENRLEPGDITADGGILNREAVTALLGFQELNELIISKEIVPGFIAPGESATLTVTLTNGSGETLTNLSVGDFFTEGGIEGGVANGMLIATPALPSTTCAGGLVSHDDISVTLSGVTLDDGASCTFSVQVTSVAVGTIVNEIPLNAISTEQGVTNSSTFAVSSLTTEVSVGVVKSFSPRTVAPEQVARLRITFYNSTPQSLIGFDLVDELPDGLVVAADANPFSNCGGAASITWPGNDQVQIIGGNLGPAVGSEAASCYLEIDVVAEETGSYTNLIPANSLTVGDEEVDHPPTEDTLEVRHPLLVNKAIGGFTLDEEFPDDTTNFDVTTGVAARLPGVSAPLIIRLENLNDTELTQVRLVDRLPEGLYVAPVPNAATTCSNGVLSVSESGREVTLTGATLPGESVCTITVDVMSNIPGVYTNTIAAGDVETFEEVTNDSPTEAELVVAEPGQVSKSFNPPVIPRDGVSVLTITIENGNDADMTLTDPLVDTLPVNAGNQMQVATVPGLANSCSGTVQAAAGATSIQVNAGTVVPPGGCVIQVNVTASEPGNYDNIIHPGDLRTNFGPNDSPAHGQLQVSPLGYISGRVFVDNETVPTGIYVPGSSTPIAGNPIELRSGSDCSGALLTTVNTDALGNYLFSELEAGTYSVCQPEQPPGTLNSITTAGTLVPTGEGSTGSASNPASGPTSQITGITLAVYNHNGDDQVSGSPNNDFSEILPASISGHVYHDRNDNGIRETGEEGIGSVRVRLYRNGGFVAETLTDGSGFYRFEGLEPGTYRLVEIQPDGWQNGQDAAGSHGGTVTDDEISDITLAPGDDAINYDFGELLSADSLQLVLSGACHNGIPLIHYALPGFGDSAPPVNIRLYSTEGRLLEQFSAQPGSGTLLWPGAAMDSNGNPTAWPGWEYVNGQWVQVDDDRVPEIVVHVQVNPETEGMVAFPDATPQCAGQPPGTLSFGETQAIPTLSTWALLLLSMMMLWIAAHHRGLLRVR